MPSESVVLVVSAPCVYCFTNLQSWWMRVWNGGCEGCGSFCLTSERFVFLKSSMRERLNSSGPLPENILQVDELLAKQGGRSVAHADIIECRVTFQGVGSSGYGSAKVSDLTIQFGKPPRMIRIRFDGLETANSAWRAMQGLRPAHVPANASPVAAELEALGIPLDFGLPASPQDGMQVAWVRSTIAFAYRTLTAGRPELAIKDAQKLINDERLRSDIRYGVIMAAAHCVRGLAHERLGETESAVADYHRSLEVQPEYPLAVQRLHRRSPPAGERGECVLCRHSNHRTDDASEGLWACPWLGATGPRSACRIRYEATGEFVFEPYDGTNCTWGTGDPVFRSIPRGYEHRPVVPLDVG